MLKRIICLFLLVIASTGIAKPNIPHKIRVGVFMIMPFAQNINGHYSGIAVDIWDNIAKSNNWDYTYIPLSPNANAELKRLTNQGDLDVIIGPVSVDSKRLQTIDFTRPFFLSSVGVITKKHDLNIFDVFKTFFSRVLFLSVLILLFSFIIFIHLLWFFERNKTGGISANYYRALSKGMWQNLAQKGLSMPTTLGGRLVTLVWIMFAAALITSINANYTAAMTVSLGQTNSRINSLEDLRAVNVAGVNGQANVDSAEQNGVAVQKVQTFEEAIDLLTTSRVDAVVCDATVGIEYLRLHGTKNYVLSPLVIDNDELAFAVRLNSQLRHQIDIGITKMQDDASVISICRRYVGEEATRCNM
jgi:polar amino acid transport system substrate-binding protein